MRPAAWAKAISRQIQLLKDSDMRSRRLSTVSYASSASQAAAEHANGKGPPPPVANAAGDATSDPVAAAPANETHMWPSAAQNMSAALHLDVMKAGWLEKRRTSGGRALAERALGRKDLKRRE